MWHLSSGFTPCIKMKQMIFSFVLLRWKIIMIDFLMFNQSAKFWKLYEECIIIMPISQRKKLRHKETSDLPRSCCYKYYREDLNPYSLGLEVLHLSMEFTTICHPGISHQLFFHHKKRRYQKNMLARKNIAVLYKLKKLCNIG